MEPHQKCLILQGIPASGKSTWARALVLSDPHWKRVNRDELRLMLHGGVWSKENEKLTRAVQMSAILNALNQGFNVVVDDTHTIPRVVRELKREVSDAFPGVGWKILRFDVPLEVCLERNAQRQGHAWVPEHVIRRMHTELANYTMVL